MVSVQSPDDLADGGKKSEDLKEILWYIFLIQTCMLFIFKIWTLLLPLIKKEKEKHSINFYTAIINFSILSGQKPFQCVCT